MLHSIITSLKPSNIINIVCEYCMMKMSIKQKTLSGQKATNSFSHWTYITYSNKTPVKCNWLVFFTCKSCRCQFFRLLCYEGLCCLHKTSMKNALHSVTVSWCSYQRSEKQDLTVKDVRNWQPLTSIPIGNISFSWCLFNV